MAKYTKADPQIAGELTEKQTARALGQADKIANSADSTAIKKEQFVFFAAFDGTRNDRGDVKLSGNPEDTNVAELYMQARKVELKNPNRNFKTGYYNGHGTKGTLTASAWEPGQVTREAIRTANKAYNEFARAASDWLKDHSDGDVTTAITSFSRGGGTAAIFSQLLYEKGLIDPKTKQQLIPPGQVGVSAGVIFDPVTTGQDGNVAFAPNVKNIAVLRAENEYRYLFKGVDYHGQEGVKIFDVTGNHCNVGGGYQHDGLGNLYLGAATQFLQNSGLPIADVDPSRLYKGEKLVAYNESGLTKEDAYLVFLDQQKHGQWDVSGYFDPNAEQQPKRLLNRDSAHPPKTIQSGQDNIKDFKLYDGSHMIETRDELTDKVRVFREKSPDEALKKHPELLGAYQLREMMLGEANYLPKQSQQIIRDSIDQTIISMIQQNRLPSAIPSHTGSPETMHSAPAFS